MQKWENFQISHQIYKFHGLWIVVSINRSGCRCYRKPIKRMNDMIVSKFVLRYYMLKRLSAFEKILHNFHFQKILDLFHYSGTAKVALIRLFTIITSFYSFFTVPFNFVSFLFMQKNGHVRSFIAVSIH